MKRRITDWRPFGPRKRSCTKHGPYDGPYCPKCFEKAMGGAESTGAEE